MATAATPTKTTDAAPPSPPGPKAPEPKASGPDAAPKPHRPDRAELRKFGLLVGSVFIALGAFTLWRGKPAPLPHALLGVGAALFALGTVAPALLYWPNRGWMALAHALGWFNTRVILGAVFFLVFTPVALIMRLFRRDPMDRTLEPARKSYWHDREKKPFNPDDYQRQF